MMVYRRRKGVILAKICGEYLLVASREAREYCPYVNQVNETAALLWELLEKGAGMDELMKRLRERYEMPEDEAARRQVEDFLNILVKNGYVIAEEKSASK